MKKKKKKNNGYLIQHTYTTKCEGMIIEKKNLRRISERVIARENHDLLIARENPDLLYDN